MKLKELLNVLEVNNTRSNHFKRNGLEPKDNRYIFIEITGYGKVGELEVQDICEGKNGTTIRLKGQDRERRR